MLTYQVDDMTCGHCVGAITTAVRKADTGAKVEVDLARHLVRIEPSAADAGALYQAITDAGYTPVAVPTSEQPAPAPVSRCGCGSGSSRCGA